VILAYVVEILALDGGRRMLPSALDNDAVAVQRRRQQGWSRSKARACVDALFGIKSDLSRFFEDVSLVGSKESLEAPSDA